MFSTAFAIVLSLIITACQGAASSEPVPAGLAPEGGGGRTLVLGDVDPDDPAQKIARFQPLADYLAARLSHLGFEAGKVVIARDIAEMGRFLSDGTVDIYMDSPFPTLMARSLSGSEVILRRWKQGSPEYFSTFFALKGGGITTLEQLQGQIVGFEEPFSTSGYILPAGTLLEQGFSPVQVASPVSGVSLDQIGYLFTNDDSDTVNLVVRGVIAAGAVSNLDLQDLDSELEEQLVYFGASTTVPRQLVSVRPGLPAEIAQVVSDVMSHMHQNEEGARILAAMKGTTKFDALPAESVAELAKLSTLIQLTQTRSRLP